MEAGVAERQEHRPASHQPPSEDPVQLFDRVGGVGAEMFSSAVRPGPQAGPDLDLPVAGTDEQDVLLVRRLGVKQHDGVRLVESGQVVEVRVLAERVFHVVVTRDLGAGWQEGDAVTYPAGQTFPALGVDG